MFFLGYHIPVQKCLKRQKEIVSTSFVLCTHGPHKFDKYEMHQSRPSRDSIVLVVVVVIFVWI